MIKRIRRVLNIKGVTLIELIISMIVMAVIMIAATTVFMPILQAYQRANNLAEVNTLLDNISSLIMSDVASATEILDINDRPDLPDELGNLTRLFSLQTTFFIDYFIDDNGFIWRDIQSLNDPIPLLPRNYYKFWGDDTVFSIYTGREEEDDEPDNVEITRLDDDNGIVTFILTIESIDGWFRTRVYTARPIGLVPEP